MFSAGISFGDIRAATNSSELPLLFVVLLRPNTALPRSKNTVWIDRGFDRLIQLQQGIIIPIVRAHDLIHRSQVGSILAPTMSGAIVNQGSDQPKSLLFILGRHPIEHNANYVI